MQGSVHSFNLRNNLSKGNNVTYSYLCVFYAHFINVISCINFFVNTQPITSVKCTKEYVKVTIYRIFIYQKVDLHSAMGTPTYMSLHVYK